MQLPLPCASVFGVDVLGMVCRGWWGVWFSPSGAPASMLLGGIVGALAVSPGWSPAPGVIHHIPPADREIFLHLRISPLNVSAAVAVASVGAQMDSRCGNVTALLTRPDLRWLT